MAQFLKFGPVEARDFDSGDATAGQVLTADGAGGAAFAAAAGGGEITSAYPVAGALRVAEAGTARCNGIYHPDGAVNGRAAYVGAADALQAIQWSGAQWEIRYDGAAYYTSADDVATPDLVTTWELGSIPSIEVMLVSDAPVEGVDGEYAQNGESEGKPFFTVENVGSIEWTTLLGGSWILYNDGFSMIQISTENVDRPDLVENWSPVRLTIANAGSAVNADYDCVSLDYNGKPYYSTGVLSLAWENDLWHIALDSVDQYTSADDVLTPDLVTTWTVANGTLPLPTIAVIPGVATITVATEEVTGALPVVTAYPHYDAGQVLTADGSGGAAFAPPAGGGGVTWTTAAAEGNCIALRDEVFTALGIVAGSGGTNLQSLASFAYLFTYGGGVLAGALWYEAGDNTVWCFRTLRNYGDPVWPTGEILFAGCQIAIPYTIENADWSGSGA